MKNTKPKVRLWSVLTGLTAILTVAAIVGNIIANQYATTINVALNASTYKIIHGENTGDTEYFKKGFASDEEREAYEAELCATVEAEGAALLKNQNAALPLAQGAKVSLFGHGSVDLMYGGTGSGNIDADPVARRPQERACDRCDFAAACAFQEGRGGDRVRYIRTVKPEEFWQFVDAENGKEGSTCR